MRYRQDRYQGVLDRFVNDGHEQVKAFSQSSRIDFYEKEAKAIYYGIFRSLTTCRAAQIHTFHSVVPMVVLTNSLIGTEHRSWG